MGKYEGHAIPGTAIMILGLYHITRAAPFRSLRALRQRQFWLVAEPAALAIYCACAVLVEFIEMATPPSNFSMSHFDHIRVNSTLSICAWVSLFHAYKDTEIAAYAHSLTSVFFTAQAVLQTAEYFILLLANKKNHTTKVEAFALKWTSSGKPFSYSYYLFGLPALLSSLFCCCVDNGNRVKAKRQEDEEVVAGINPAYTNPVIYSTPLPMLKGLVVLLNGVWWWVMALYFFEERGDDGDFKIDVPEEFRNGPMMYHFIYADMIYPHLLWITSALVLFFIVMARLERGWCSAADHQHHYHQQGVFDCINYALIEKATVAEEEGFGVEMAHRVINEA